MRRTDKLRRPAVWKSMTYIFAQSNNITNKLWTKRNTSATIVSYVEYQAKIKLNNFSQPASQIREGTKNKDNLCSQFPENLLSQCYCALNVQLWPQVPIARLIDISFDS